MIRRKSKVIAAAAAVLVIGASLAPAAGAAAPSVAPKWTIAADNLNNPRQVAVNRNGIYWAMACAPAWASAAPGRSPGS